MSLIRMIEGIDSNKKDAVRRRYSYVKSNGDSAMQKDYKKILEEKIAAIRSKERAEQFAQLADLKKRFSDDIDRRLERLRDKRDLVREAMMQRVQLRVYHVAFFRFFTHVRLRHVVSVPFIYAMIVPIVIMHVFLEVYHQIGFRLYHIPRVRLSDHLVFDRGHLAYLNWFEKMNCAYCSYFNGMISYTREIAGRTERYWCPIKHAKNIQHHSQYEHFVDYLDGRAYRENLHRIRTFDESIKS